MNWTFLLISVWVAITIFYYWRMGRVLFPKSRFPFREIYLQDSDEQRETEKRATVRGSKEPLRGDDAESEQQGEGSETSKNTLENIPRGF